MLEHFLDKLQKMKSSGFKFDCEYVSIKSQVQCKYRSVCYACVWVNASILAPKIVGKDTIQKANYITQSVSESLG